MASIAAALGLFAAGGAVSPRSEASADASAPAAVDLMLFIGQSNMAGRGNASDAVAVGEGHAYEFRAVSDPTRLYPVTEPFGVGENNAQSGVTENKKTGSLVSAFCESYYAATNTPIVAVSCSKGGTGINFWDTNRPAFDDACDRLAKAKEFLGASVRNTYLVWMQGETDGDNCVTAERYTKTLDKIFKAFRDVAGVKQSFVIPIGEFNGASADTKAYYDVIRSAQKAYCEGSELATVVSVKAEGLSEYGFMVDNFHYNQAGYNIMGADAGANAAYYVNTGSAPTCVVYEPNRTPLKTGGAWTAQNGRVVISAAAALENSTYASATSVYVNNVRYYWRRYNGGLDGIEQLPDTGNVWNKGTGFDRAPQLNFTFSVDKPAKYYLYFLTSHPDTAGNSMLASLDGEPLVECALGSYGKNVWQSDAAWAFDVATAGEHTLTVCAREDGVVINQIVLSENANERFSADALLEESDRLPIVERGAYVEVNGKVTIDLVSALENGDACSNASGLGSGDYNGITYFWEHGTNGRGMQIVPKDNMLWTPSSQNKPALSYDVELTTTGDYYVYLYASFADANSDSALIGLDGGTPRELALSYSASGGNRWTTSSAWKINVPTAGKHTVNVYARESGANMHLLYLSKTQGDCVGAATPAASPRLSDQTPAVENNGVAFMQTSGKTSATARFTKPGEYTLYAPSGNVSVTVGGKTLSAVGSGKAWVELGKFTAAAGDVTFDITGGAEYLYAEHADVAAVEGLRTLVLGDSYTHKTYWTTFDEQMREIGAKTIGVSGSEVDNWVGRVSEFSLYRPQNVVIHLGVNDINRGESGTSCGQALIGFISSIKSAFPGARIFYVSICDNNSNSGKWSEYAVSNGLVEAFAEQTDDVYYIDFNTEMKRHASEMTNNGFSGDNLHMNAQGYERFSAMIKQAILAAESGV